MAVDNKSDQLYIQANQTFSVNFNRGNGRRHELQIVNDSGASFTWSYSGLIRKNFQYAANVLAAGPLVFLPGRVNAGQSWSELTNVGSQAMASIARNTGSFGAPPVARPPVAPLITEPNDPQFVSDLGEWAGAQLQLNPSGGATIIANYVHGCAIEAWVYLKAVPTATNSPVYTEQNAGGTHYAIARIDANQYPELTWNDVATSYDITSTNWAMTASNKLNLNTWYHVVWNFLGDTGSPANAWQVYINGTQAGSNFTPAAGGLPFFTDTNVAYLGPANTNSNVNFLAPAVYGAALNATRIKQHYLSMITGSWFTVIDSGTLGGGASIGRAYGDGTQYPVPDVAQLTFTAGAADATGGWQSRMLE